MIEHDQRRGKRYEVGLPCRLFSPFQAFEKLSGVTVNMSRNGVLLAIEQNVDPERSPQVGHAARIVLQLPGSGREKGRYVECMGRVVRIEDKPNLMRIALEFRRFEFIETPETDLL